MHATKEAAARAIADYHRLAEDSIVLIARYRSSEHEPDSEPIRLLEVNADTPASGIVPVHFGPTRDTPYPIVVIEITPEEYRGLVAGELRLPDGWRLQNVLYKSTLAP
ncbi:MAG: hypothetical protein ACOZNI_27885 [Myxococcota bacterium]|jgi:hypothetical protein